MDKARHAATIENGRSYRILNSASGDALAVNLFTTEAVGDNTAGYDTELWTVEAGEGGYAFKNKLNGLYLQKFSNGHYKLAAQTAYFEAELCDSGKWETTYVFKESDGQGLVLPASGGAVTKGNVEQGPAIWILNATAAEASTAVVDSIYLNRAFAEQTVRFRNRARGNYIASDSTGSYNTVMKAKDEADLSQVWIVLPQPNGLYMFRNAKTGRYIRYVGELYTAYPTSSSGQVFRVRLSPGNASATNGDRYFNISQGRGYDDQSCWHDDGHDRLVKWNSGASTPASDWVVEKVENFTDAEVKASLNTAGGYANEIESGKMYRLQNYAYPGRTMTENYSSHYIGGNATEAKTGYQNWRIIKVGEEYAFQNAYTERYIQINTGGQSTYYQTGTEQQTFTLAKHSSRWEDTYTISDGGGDGLHCAQSQGYSVVKWDLNSSGSIWKIMNTDMTEEEMAEAIAGYKQYTTEKANENAYTARLEKFFTTTLCTELRPEYKSMSDDELRAAMDSLPEAMKNMAVKVKNNSWAKWEKMFRVSDFKGYSNPDAWAGTLGMGFPYARLSNPTGINYNSGQTMYIILGDDKPQNSTVQIEAVNVNSYANGGQLYTLHKGLNILNLPMKSTLFVRYTLDTKNSGKVLADFPRINLHFEGGHVNGYYDIERHSQEQWAEMRNDATLFNDYTIQLKSHRCIFNMNSHLVQQQIGDNQITASMDMWDTWLKIDQDLMALEEYTDRWNNLMGVYSNTDGGLYTTSYGVYFGEGATWIMNPVKGRESGGAIWAQVHEMGHMNQDAINMGGCVEISNNMFANAACFHEGFTTRVNGASTAGLANHFVNKNFWFKLAGQSGYGMRLYTQLYLYFHVLKHDTQFFPKLYKKLRADRMRSTGGVYRGPNDYLKFALACCEVSGYDLSEFFEAYGFFVPVNNQTYPNTYNVGFTFRTTQAEIDAAKAAMKKYAKPRGNIFFLDDHIRREPGRRDYGGSDVVGRFGDVGMYSDFRDDFRSSNYSYTLSSDSVITMKGEGAVGFKLYDDTGNLLYFFNTNSVRLPGGVRGKNFTLKVAQADGTDVVVPKPDEAVYRAEVYKGSSAKYVRRVSLSSGAGSMPELADNGIAIVKGENVPEEILQIANVADSTMNAQSIVIKDKDNFYAPAEIHAASVEYARSNTAAYNSVCLPFELSLSDLGEGAKIETFEGVVENGGKEYLMFRSNAQTVAAGQPCIVWCPSTMTEWNISKTGVSIAATPAELASGNFVMKGSFANDSIGAGKYKMNGAGTAFGLTTKNGKITAFRSYLDSKVPASSRTLGIMHQSPTTGVNAALQSPSLTIIYDLQGRRVGQPKDGGIYIINGEKVILRER